MFTYYHASSDSTSCHIPRPLQNLLSELSYASDQSICPQKVMGTIRSMEENSEIIAFEFIEVEPHLLGHVEHPPKYS